MSDQKTWVGLTQCQTKFSELYHRIKISNRRATQRCNVSSFFYAKICSLLARRQSSQPVQHVYWPENVIDWLGKWRPTCVMRHARGQKLQSFRRKWPFYMDLYSMTYPNLDTLYMTRYNSSTIIILVPRIFLGKTLVLSGHVTLQKLIAQGGVAKYQITCLKNVTVNFKYQEWDFTIHRSKRSLTSILYFCLLLNYKSTVAFYQQSSQQTNKSYALKLDYSPFCACVKNVNKCEHTCFDFVCSPVLIRICALKMADSQELYNRAVHFKGKSFYCWSPKPPKPTRKSKRTFREKVCNENVLE
jgi:hypothetical protein